MRNGLGLIAAIVAALVSLFTSAAPTSAQQLWSVWNNTASCAPTRNHWLSVAQTSPGFGFIQWSTFSTADFTAAIAQMDSMRLSEGFRNYCCKFSIWSFSPTNQKLILKDGEVAGQNYLLERSGMCADDAAISAGISAPHLTDVSLGSVPGVALRATATGFTAVAATPVTIPSTPPIIVAPAPPGTGTGTGPGTGTSAAFTIEPNTDRPGSDYRTLDLPQNRVELCRDACAADSKCVAFTFVKAGVQAASARCWLKTSAPKSAPRDCCTSGVRR